MTGKTFGGLGRGSVVDPWAHSARVVHPGVGPLAPATASTLSSRIAIRAAWAGPCITPILGRPDQRASYARSPVPRAFPTWSPRVLCAANVGSGRCASGYALPAGDRGARASRIGIGTCRAAHPRWIPKETPTRELARPARSGCRTLDDDAVCQSVDRDAAALTMHTGHGLPDLDLLVTVHRCRTPAG